MPPGCSLPSVSCLLGHELEDWLRAEAEIARSPH
ncbi:MAG: DUF2934 domain-containing protein [Gammaproteobacteria bacterium]|nr:DUF2934 domain-containing protein [Gammaproteobacteria bacterium]